MVRNYCIWPGTWRELWPSNRIKALFVTLFFLSLLWTGVLGVTILNVGDGYAFGSIQAAIDAALVISNDDEVQICVAP